MKHIRSTIAALMVVMIAGCGTLGGAISGAGDDLKSAGDWIKNTGK